MLSFFNEYVFGIAVPISLMGAGIFYGFRLRWFHLLRPRAVWRTLTEPSEGGVSSARALSLALAGTLGVGNIVGVSAAIAMGGFGAIFWMWISALCAMLLKYAEIVLAMRHRRYDGQGAPHGAAMYYIRDFFVKQGMARVGSVLAALFALLCVVNAVTMGSAIQVNAIAHAVSGIFDISVLWVGGVLAVVTLAVIRKGSGGVLRITDKLVPLMTAGYLILSVAALWRNADEIPYALGRILRDALTPSSAVGGIGGFLFSKGIRYGTMRGIISNEAGCGTAPTAHAVSSCRMPAKQGVWGIFEVFADTVVLCTVTALVVIVSYDEAVARETDFMMMTVRAYGAALGAFAEIFMVVLVVFFGFATVICWAHYGLESVRYLCRGTLAQRGFVWGYSTSVLLGAVLSSDVIWELADFAIGAMTLINLVVICAMHREVKEETELWLLRSKK